MPVGKSFDRAHLGCLNASKVVEDDTRNPMRISGHDAILPSTARNGTGALPLGATAHGEGAQLAPSKVMSIHGLRSSKFLGPGQ